MNFPLILNLAIALVVCGLLYRLQATHASFTKRVFTGLDLGVLLGGAFQVVYGATSTVVVDTSAWLDVIVFHELLQWHHLISGPVSADTLSGLQRNAGSSGSRSK